MNVRDEIRKNVREIREAKGITQIEMAEKLGLSPTGYAKLERGETQIRIERLIQIAQILEVELTDLIPPQNQGTLVFHNSNDNFSNSTNFSLAIGNPALESKIQHLNYMIEAKNELLDARDREIELLKEKILALNKMVELFEKK